ncbi:MAG: IPTL-CTERM sorting domain-containing protein [Planctomycetota bacterium]
MSHKKYLCGLSVLALVVSAVNAAPQNVQLLDSERPGGTPGSPTAFTTVLTTGFEAVDGWDVSTSFGMCGLEFAGCTQPPGMVCGSGPALDLNCCDLDPNFDTGWFLNISNKHCREPHIDNLNPKTGTQHLRFQYDPLGGEPAGCEASGGFGAGCRQRINTAYDKDQGAVGISKTTYEYEIAFSTGIGTLTEIRNYIGIDMGANNGVYSNAMVYWIPAGKVYGFEYAGYASRARHLLGYWFYDAPNYMKISVDLDPCNNVIKYTFTGIPGCVPPAEPPGCNPFGNSTGVSTYTTFFDFTPPYGNFTLNSGADNSFPVVNSMVWNQSHRNATTKVDVDNFVITHVGCPDACCHGGTGLCEEGLTQEACEATPYSHYYPNVQCSKLGKGRCTDGPNVNFDCTTNADCPQSVPPVDPAPFCEFGVYPPACSMDKGSCCDAGPGSGGSCTDGVLEADCQPPQKTWARGGSCTAIDFAGVCHVGEGRCSAITDRPKFCMNLPDFAPCATDADCFVDGFCYGGTCAPPPQPSHCEYTGAATLGFCQTMGRCSGSAACVAATGAGCCDLTCLPPVGCPGTETCIAEPQGCNVIPGGADCAFCEGCDAWPATRGWCTVVADCPDIPGLVAACVINPPPTGCNLDSDCPGDQQPCVIPLINPRGVLCADDADCVINVPATICGPEHTGACCHGTTGLCDNDVLEANCRGDQVVWTKLGVCATLDPPCVQHTGACCNVNPKAVHCADTFPQDCPTTGDPNVTWHKGVLCTAVPYVCPAVVLGACCNTLAGTCLDNQVVADCSGPQRVFSVDKTCANITCDAVLGACCDHDTFGGCTDVTSAECVPGPDNKLEWTKLAACADIECLHEAIPTVSQWGLVVLTLLLLVGAKVYFGRRQSAAA